MQRLSSDELRTAAAITLMSTDVMGVEQIISLIHETWAAFLELALGVYILYLFVGLACLLIFIPSLIATVVAFYASKNMAKARKKWNERISDRVQATSTVLRQLRDVKATGLSHALSDHLQHMREVEVRTSLRERRSRVMLFAISAFNLNMTPVVVLAGARFWTRAATPMTAAEVFSAFAVVLIASEPLDDLLGRTIYWASSYACIQRIRDYLVLEEIEDKRQISTSSGSINSDVGEKTVPIGESETKIAVRLENVTVVSNKGREVLKDVSLHVEAGSLAMVHGTVGSGKSVFLQTLLGEIAPRSGTVSIASTDFSYAAQKSWLRNRSIRENVIGRNKFIESLYKEVINGCALDVDIAELPAGDETVIGTNGCNLSGGQKQRLELARSMYIETSIIILDDVLSALDTLTAATVFTRLFGANGLARRRGTTVIMTTNRVDLLPEADVVFEMNGLGSMRREERNERQPVQQNEGQSGSDDEISHDGITGTFLEEKVQTAAKFKAIPDSAASDKKRSSGDISLYGYFFRSAGLLVFSVSIFFVAVASVAEKMPKIYMKLWYNAAPENDNYFIGFALLALANIICTAGVGVYFFVMVVPKLSNELHLRLLQSTVGSTLAWITQTDTGSSLNRFSQDIAVISQMLPAVFLSAIFIFFNMLVDVGIIAGGAKFAAPVIVLVFVVLYGVQYFYLRTSRQLRLLELEAVAPLTTQFEDTASGIQHVRAFRWQAQLMADCCTLVENSLKPYYSLLSVQQWLAFVLDAATCFMATILIGVATTVQESTSDTSLGLALLNLVSFSVMTAELVRVWVLMENSLGALARLRDFCATTPQERDGPGCTDVPEDWPATGKIEIESISASYEYEDGTLHQALDNATVSIQHGEKVGISGRTGSGKSSMFLALLHMIECSGTIRIDGRDITTVPREVLRSRITTLTQDGVEVEETVRFNIYPFDADDKPTDDDILGTLNLVGLREYVDLQGGIDQDMNEMKFSPGQKQLFFVARGILHHKKTGSKIVMMDEATSSMDYGVDSKIQQLIDEEMRDCTIVLIAHRLHTLKNADVVVKLEAGKVMEVLRKAR